MFTIIIYWIDWNSSSCDITRVIVTTAAPTCVVVIIVIPLLLLLFVIIVVVIEENIGNDNSSGSGRESISWYKLSTSRHR